MQQNEVCPPGVTRPPPDKPERKRVPASLLRAARLSCGYTQEQLAAVMDIRKAAVSERENAEDGVKLEVWLAVSQALGLPVEWEPVEPETPTTAELPKDDG